MSPELLQGAIDRLFQYINDTASAPHVRTAVSDLEFEASHPFKDGNGRIGRVLIPLMLWQLGLIAEPHFYISNFFEEHRHAYIDKIRAVSASGAWLEWITFFLNALEVEAQSNLSKAAKMRDLYEDMTGRFRHALASQWSTNALAFMFTRPIFRNRTFTTQAGMPAPTAHRVIRSLVDAELLRTLAPASGRRPALYPFEPPPALARD